MSLGKRTRRPPVKRTTSMSDITFDLTTYDESQPSDIQNLQQRPSNIGLNGLDSMVSPRNHRRNFSGFLETTHFLNACFLCKCRLIPGRDIYMYRGDSAFCSLECRQLQMNQDERKEKKCSFVSKKEINASSSSSSSSSTSASQVVPNKGETVAV